MQYGLLKLVHNKKILKWATNQHEETSNEYKQIKISIKTLSATDLLGIHQINFSINQLQKDITECNLE